MRIRSILVAAGLVFGSASPVSAADGGHAVGIVVVDVGACIMVDGGFDFGVHDLGELGPLISLPQTVTVTNCNERHVADIYGRGTDAIGDGSVPAKWTLHQAQTYDCATFQPNRYKVGVQVLGVSSAPTILSYTDTLVPFGDPAFPSPGLAAGGTGEFASGLWMPCQGSAGAGQSMTFSFIFTAVLRDD